MFLSNFSVKKPVAMIVVIIMLMAMGLLALSKLRVNQIPDVQEPVISRVTFASLPVLTYAVEASDMDAEDLSWFVDNIVNKRLLSVRGVAKVTRQGGVDREVRVQLDPVRLQALNVSAADISAQVRGMQQEAPGGRGNIGGQEQAVRTLGTVKSARELAQIMVAIGRRNNKKVIALLTDMNQPLGYAIGNALEIMEVSQTLQNGGPVDLTRLSLELAARMIHLGKVTATIEEARELAQAKLLDGSGFRKLKEVIAAQGGNPQVLDRFDLLPNATGMREVLSPRAGFVSAIKAEDIGRASQMMGAGRMTKEDAIDHAVGVILEVKVGEKVEAGSVLCRLYYTGEEHLDEAADLVEDAFRVSSTPPEPQPKPDLTLRPGPETAAACAASRR